MLLFFPKETGWDDANVIILQGAEQGNYKEQVCGSVGAGFDGQVEKGMLVHKT